MALAPARGQDPAQLPRQVPTAGAASSLVYRHFDAARPPPPEPTSQQRDALAQAFGDALLFTFPKKGSGLRIILPPGGLPCRRTRLTSNVERPLY
jgi:hypothetical protein